MEIAPGARAFGSLVYSRPVAVRLHHSSPSSSDSLGVAIGSEEADVDVWPETVRLEAVIQRVGFAIAMSPASPRRRTRPTLRCLTADFGLEIPPLTTELCSVDHPVMAEARRLAPHTPKGQKRVRSIAKPLIYRLRHSRWRAATWLETSTTNRFWVLAAAQREEGSRDDAFEHFESLYVAGQLLPSSLDEIRDQAESAARLLRDARDQAAPAIAQARASLNTPVFVQLDNRVDVRVAATARDMLWFGVRIISATGETLTSQVRGTVFAILMEALGAPFEYEDTVCWADGELLPFWEVARVVVV